MARWEPGAPERLRRAALELYREHGFEEVTAAAIAERAGLTRRTFFRHFADTREVLFAGSEQLPGMVTAAIDGADATLEPFDAVLHALTVVGTRLAEVAEHPRERRAVIAASPGLQERERTKQAALTSALADGLRRRGVADPVAEMIAQVGVAIFRAAFDRWIDLDGGVAFDECSRVATAELRSALTSRPG